MQNILLHNFELTFPPPALWQSRSQMADGAGVSTAIRFNAVAPGVVDTPMRRNDPDDSTLQPPMKKATAKDVVDVVLYLARAGHGSGEILHVDGAALARR
jgi:NAD(P)-dependent dehydrogenase (short-subunit alcohol dehydrogenase family)